jgi:DNA transformation protein
MANGSEQYADFVIEQLTPLRGVERSRFFGGIGLAFNGVQFAMVMDSTLYFVVDDTTRPKYEQMKSSCFFYETKKRRVEVKKYYTVPAELIEDQDRLVSLAKESIRVASSAKSSKPKRATQKHTAR